MVGQKNICPGDRAYTHVAKKTTDGLQMAVYEWWRVVFLQLLDIVIQHVFQIALADFLELNLSIFAVVEPAKKQPQI